MRPVDAVAAAEAGADFVGVMFANSRRRLSLEQAAEIVHAVGTPLRDMEQEEPPPMHRPAAVSSNDSDASIAAWFAHGAAALDRLLARKRPLVVGVFEDQDVEDVNQIADETGIDLVQLSGNEPWSDCLLVNRQAIKVFRQRRDTSSEDVASYIEPGTALAFMLDPSSGTGTAIDLGVAAAVAARVPLWLAGGLTPQTVAEAIDRVHPWAVDVSSGVETDGAKDPRKIADFIGAVRGVHV
jgi:phosphoribosylanthranilate isomerase